MSIEILSSGMSSTLQDGGRFGVQDQGIPISGFMDVGAATLANLLVNNSKNSVLIEMTMLGIKFKAKEDVTIAITGADMQPKVAGVKIKMNKAITIAKNTVVTMSGAKSGVYGYIAVAGEFNAKKDFGSKANYVPAKLGGIHGSTLQKGDVLSVINKRVVTKKAKVKYQNYPTNAVLTCLVGPEYYLFSKKSVDVFFNTTFKIHANSNRIGIRLEGNLITLPKKDEIISSGIVKGTVQITKGGQPIVMMADAPTTGGYLRMLNLTEQACNTLAQLPVGGKVRFKLQDY